MQGPTLRLLLDSGAADIVIGKKAAERSGLETPQDFLQVCPNGPPGKVRRGAAQAVAAGPITFRNLPVNVAPGKLADGLDGVIPLAVFRAFLVHLDLPNKALILDPYPQDAPTASGFARMRPGEDLVILESTLNRRQVGYVMLDTGSSYAAVSHEVANALKSVFVSQVSIRGGNGVFEADLIRPSVQFQIGDRDLRVDQVVAIDFSTFSRFHGYEIAGVLGYPDLRNKVLTVDYRDSLVQVATSFR